MKDENRVKVYTKNSSVIVEMYTDKSINKEGAGKFLLIYNGFTV